jgi:hypothetical protein
MKYASCICTEHGSIDVSPDEEGKRILLDLYYRGQKSALPLAGLSISFGDAKYLAKALLDVTEEAEKLPEGST